MMRLLVFGMGLLVLVCGAVSPASAQRLRRPYHPALAFNYGFDNRGGGGCTDWNCGGHCYDGHTGTDQPVGLGTDVLAGAGGRVTAVNNGCANYGSYGNTCGGRCGNYVQVTHDDGTVATYCHMRLDAHVVSNGQRVSCGQKLGQSASSGSSTGPHLHLTWRHGGANKDSFRGGCTSSPGAWHQQRGYRDPVGTDCVSTCQPSNEVCDGQDNDCDGQVDEGVKNACGGCGAVPAEVCDGRDNDCDGQVDEDDLCEIQFLNGQISAYAPARTSDVNGDGKADVCGRGGAGLWCHMSNGQGFTLDPRTQIVPMASDSGWGEAQYYATIRMGDIDNDGLADVCARASSGVICWAADGVGGWERIDGPPLSNDAGWSSPAHYTTLRLADINGDGKDDLCARAPSGIQCWPSTGRGFGEVINGPAWSNDNGFAGAAKYYGTLRMGDINGDGRDDICIRHSEAFVCAPSNGAGFDEPIEVAKWSDVNGWGHMVYWPSITLADVNGDGKDDVCARDSAALRCSFSRGDGFEEPVVVAELSDALGWNDISNWATLRVGDLNDDGREDLCVRSNAGMRCWAWDGEAFATMSGPGWSDEQGWAEVGNYATIRMGDVDGDGLDDLCARAHAGWGCHLSTGTGFSVDGLERLDEFKSESGWSAEQHWSSMQLGGPRCSPERCNGRDDDCDGLIDDDPSEAGEQCDPGTGDPCELGLTVCSGAQIRCEPMRVMREDCAPLGQDMGAGAPDDGVQPNDPPGMGHNVAATGEVGCACQLAPSPRAPGALWFALLGLVALARRRWESG